MRFSTYSPPFSPPSRLFVVWPSIQIRLISSIGETRMILTTNNRPLSQRHGPSRGRPNIAHVISFFFFFKHSLNFVIRLPLLPPSWEGERSSKSRFFGSRTRIWLAKVSALCGHLFANLCDCCFNPAPLLCCTTREKSRISEDERLLVLRMIVKPRCTVI